MRKRIRLLLTVPPAIQLEFWQDSLGKNRISLLVISAMIFAMELFNIARVLFWSASGLRSVNNRIYFGMYCALMLGAFLILLLQYLLRKASLEMQRTLQLAAVGFFFLWHIALNAYDLTRDPAAGAYSFITAIVGIAMFIQIPSILSVSYFLLGYALFMLASASVLDAGTIINLTITTIVALAISLTRCRHAVIDLSQRREISRMNDRLQQLLREEPLTGLLNAKAFRESITSSLEAVTPEEPLALYMVDLDDFKSVNDKYGHLCGDYVLEETACRLRAVFPEAICIGRAGGDEFAALIHGKLEPGILEQKGYQLIQALSGICWSGQSLGITCSIGILSLDHPGVGYEQFYAQADDALYAAKRSGKGRCCFRKSSTIQRSEGVANERGPAAGKEIFDDGGGWTKAVRPSGQCNAGG